MVDVTALTKADADLCPIRQVLSKVTGKWQMLIILALEQDEIRFGALKRSLGDISQRVLTENLRTLERDGHVIRTVHHGPPLAVSYALSEQGGEICELLKPLAHWAASTHDAVSASRRAYDD